MENGLYRQEGCWNGPCPGRMYSKTRLIRHFFVGPGRILIFCEGKVGHSRLFLFIQKVEL